jgi:hypothetical protein
MKRISRVQLLPPETSLSCVVRVFYPGYSIDLTHEELNGLLEKKVLDDIEPGLSLEVNPKDLSLMRQLSSYNN